MRATSLGIIRAEPQRWRNPSLLATIALTPSPAREDGRKRQCEVRATNDEWLGDFIRTRVECGQIISVLQIGLPVQHDGHRRRRRRFSIAGRVDEKTPIGADVVWTETHHSRFE